MEKYIIDRIEGDTAVLECENGSMTDISAALIESCHEGDVVIHENGVWRVDEALTEQRKEIIKEKMKKLFD